MDEMREGEMREGELREGELREGDSLAVRWMMNGFFTCCRTFQTV